MQKCEFGVDLNGAVYQSLIEVALQQQLMFSLVLRSDTTYSPRAHSIVAQLCRGSAETENATSWPGTRLLEGTALLISGVVDRHQAIVLADSQSLFSWRHPDLPEDLALYRGSDVLLYCTSHEKTTWIDLMQFPVHFQKILRTHIPSLDSPSSGFRQ